MPEVKVWGFRGRAGGLGGGQSGREDSKLGGSETAGGLGNGSVNVGVGGRVEGLSGSPGGLGVSDNSKSSGSATWTGCQKFA